MIHFFRPISILSAAIRRAFVLALLGWASTFFTAAHGNEPSALELRQMQTRIFKTVPKTVNSAVQELCNNRSGIININVQFDAPENMCYGAFRLGGVHSFSYSLSKEKNGATLIRLHLKAGGMSLITASEDYDLFFKSLADILVLNEMGVEIKVFR